MLTIDANMKSEIAFSSPASNQTVNGRGHSGAEGVHRVLSAGPFAQLSRRRGGPFRPGSHGELARARAPGQPHREQDQRLQVGHDLTSFTRRFCERNSISGLVSENSKGAASF